MSNKKRPFKKLKTPVFRVSFPKVFKPGAYENNPPKYSLSAIWTPANFTQGEKKLWKELMEEMDAAAMHRFDMNIAQLREANAEGADYKIGLRDGKIKKYSGYGPGTMYASLSSKLRPGVIDLSHNEISPEMGNEDEFYPGCYARATVSVYSYNTKGQGVSIGLMNIQKVREGDRLDSRTEAKDDFDGDDLNDLGIDVSKVDDF